MNNLHLSEEAQNDLFEIKSYNEEELLNPSAALATVSRITKSLRILQNYAQTGAPLSSIADIKFLLTVFSMPAAIIYGFCLETVQQMNKSQTIEPFVEMPGI